MFVRRAPAFGDHAFPAFASRAIPRLRIVDDLDSLHRRFKGHRSQQRAAFFEWQRCRRTAIQPEDVEHVITAAAIPGHFAVEYEVLDWKRADRLGDGRQSLRKTIARVQPDVVTLLVREQTDAVELALEEPVGSGETVLRQRCRHRLEPFGCRHSRRHKLRDCAMLHRIGTLLHLRCLFD